MNDQTTRQSEHKLDELLAAVREHAWAGPGHSNRVDAFLQEQTMRQDTKRNLNRTTIALIVAGVLGGGAVAAGITHQIMSARAKIIAADGTEYNVELLPTPEGAGGTFVTDDGAVYGINMTQGDAGDHTVTVDVDSPVGGTSTIILDDDTRPSMTVAPGEKASLRIGQVPAKARFIDEDGVEHEVDADAAAAWVTKDDDAPEGTGG